MSNGVKVVVQTQISGDGMFSECRAKENQFQAKIKGKGLKLLSIPFSTIFYPDLFFCIF